MDPRLIPVALAAAAIEGYVPTFVSDIARTDFGGVGYGMIRIGATTSVALTGSGAAGVRFLLKSL